MCERPASGGNRKALLAMMLSMEEPTHGSIEQASVIPYRRTEQGLEFCLITSTKKGRWGVPKGFIDQGESAQEAALKEAEEEAGLLGRIISDEVVGRYKYRKWGSKLIVNVYLMEVHHAAEEWLECDLRQRCWCTANEACELIDRAELVEILEIAVTQIEQEHA